MGRLFLLLLKTLPNTSGEMQVSRQASDDRIYRAWRRSCAPDVPQVLSSTAIWSSIPDKPEIGHEERFSEEQIIGFPREAEAGMAVKDLCRRHGFSEASYQLWRSKFGGMSVPDAKRLKDLEAENVRLKKLLAEQLFENDLIKDALRER